MAIYWDDVVGAVILLVLVILGIGLLAGATVLLMGLHTPVQESQYTGHVVDVEYEKGLFWDVTTVHLKTHPRSSSGESVCVLDAPTNPMMDGLREAAHTQERITVTYSNPLIVWPWDCRTVPILQSYQLSQTEGGDA